jgi:hypothetical protein
VAGILSLLATATAGSLVWFLARARFGLSPVVALPLAIGPFMFDSAVQYYSLPISESWYAMLWALVVLAAFRVCAESNARASRDAVVLGLLIAAAMLIRSQALALFVGAVPRAVLRASPPRGADHWDSPPRCQLSRGSFIWPASAREAPRCRRSPTNPGT